GHQARAEEVDGDGGPGGDGAEGEPLEEVFHREASSADAAPVAPASSFPYDRAPWPSYSQQAAHWPSARSKRGGSSVRQRSMAWGQRGWKRQPVGGAMREGGSPVPVSSRSASAATRSGSGAEAMRSWV